MFKSSAIRRPRLIALSAIALILSVCAHQFSYYLDEWQMGHVVILHLCTLALSFSAFWLLFLNRTRLPGPWMSRMRSYKKFCSRYPLSLTALFVALVVAISILRHSNELTIRALNASHQEKWRVFAILDTAICITFNYFSLVYFILVEPVQRAFREDQTRETG